LPDGGLGGAACVGFAQEASCTEGTGASAWWIEKEFGNGEVVFAFG
jgi:hypothetical protein